MESRVLVAGANGPLEKGLGRGARRRHIPVFAMKLLSPVVRPFNELAARMMTFGYFATVERPFPDWEKSADRFDVRPRTLEEHINRLGR